ncbi:MAG: hypothetical protein IIC24_09440, partial [Chloroflexi bacterium]|nr:hypothetical protein [Chloroflexota bacterium]
MNRTFKCEDNITMQKSEYQSAVTRAIDANREELVDISMDIHAHPE